MNTPLFEPFTFPNGLTLRNVIMALMTTWWSASDDQTVSDEEISYYRRRVRGVGLVLTGCTHVAANGIGFTGEFASYDDKFTPSLRRLADAAKSGGAPRTPLNDARQVGHLSGWQLTRAEEISGWAPPLSFLSDHRSLGNSLDVVDVADVVSKFAFLC